MDPLKLHVFWQQEGGGGGSNVQNLPEVPSPSEADLEALAGDEDEGEEEAPTERGRETPEAEGEGEEEEERETPPPERKPEPPRREEKEEEEPEIRPEGEEEEEKPPKVEEKPEKIPSLRAIKEKYPNFLKEFPNVRTAIAEHQQLRNIFTSLEEAREAAETQQDFLFLSDVVMKGDVKSLFDEIEKEDPEALSRFARNVLPSLLEKNRDLYLDITDMPIKQFVKAAYDRAKAEGNQNLVNSAQYLWKFLTGRFEPPHIEDRIDPNEKALNDKIEKFEQQKYAEARKQVESDIEAQMEPIIAKAIDPNNVLKEFTRNSLIRSILGEVDSILAKDELYMGRVNRHWSQARRSSYSREHTSRVVTAYLERAKQVLPKLAQKVREEHNIQIEPEKKKEGERPPAQAERRPPPRPPLGGPPAHRKTLRETNPRDIDWRKSKDEDILGGKAFLKKR